MEPTKKAMDDVCGEARGVCWIKWVRNRQRADRWQQCLIGVLLFLVVISGSPAALASIHTYPEGQERVMYRSLQTLRDRSNRAWQVVLFKRMQSDQVESLHLRLVGFPGVTELEHPQPLQITTGTEQVWQAPDALRGGEFDPNVGEYDVLAMLTQLDSNTPLRLAMPVKQRAITPSQFPEGVIELPIPPFVVQEWRQLVDQP